MAWTGLEQETVTVNEDDLARSRNHSSVRRCRGRRMICGRICQEKRRCLKHVQRLIEKGRLSKAPFARSCVCHLAGPLSSSRDPSPPAWTLPGSEYGALKTLFFRHPKR